MAAQLRNSGFCSRNMQKEKSLAAIGGRNYMTFVEFFEKDALENLCSCLTVAPDKIILIGDNRKVMQSHADRYERLLRARREVVDFEIISVDKNNIYSILHVLEKIVTEEDECAFDLTGGEDIYLVAMGIVFERHKDKKPQMHRFNIRNNTVFDCDLDGTNIASQPAPEIGIEELIYAYGGEVVYEDEYEHGTHEWTWSDEFYNQILQMWEICRKDVRLWNLQVGMLELIEVFNNDPEGNLTTMVPVAYLEDYLKSQGRDFFANRRILRDLVSAGLITLYEQTDDTITVSYCDFQVKRCLTKAGQILELAVCTAAKKATEPDGSNTYHDVMTGVTIDWDGVICVDESAYDTANEIDVIMVRGMVPVFVSCKNGNVDSGELYKLNTVAERFGGKYAKKVLIATALDPEDIAAQYLCQRAEDMKINIITSFQNLDLDGINKLVRSLWKQ